jgi:hypothetical protein
LIAAGLEEHVGFESNEPDEKGGTRYASSVQLQVTAEQSYRVAFTLLKQTCMLSAGRLDATGEYEETAAAEGKMRRVKGRK